MIVIFSFIVFLFALFAVSRDDFIFLRKNLSLELLFDIVFLASIAGLIFSRIAYVLMHLSSAYLNPLVFLLVPYFPGLSLAGFLLGGMIVIYAFSVRQKMPTMRLFDAVGISAIVAFALYLFLQAGFFALHKQFLFTGLQAGEGIVALVWFFLARSISINSAWKDGFISLVTLFFISLLAVFSDFIVSGWKIPMETFIFAGVLLLFILGLVIRSVRRKRPTV